METKRKCQIVSLRTCIVVAAGGVAVDDCDVEGAAVLEVREDENVEAVVDTETTAGADVEGFI